jgi:ABC-type multidrug transport system fused ATPase/permease subunit
MAEPRLSTRRVLELMQHLQQLANRRAEDERMLRATLDAEISDAELELQSTAERLEKEHAQRRRALEQEYAAAHEAATATFEAGQREAERVRGAARKDCDARHAAIVAAAEQKSSDAQWQALAVYDAHKNQPQQQLDEAHKRVAAKRRQVDGLERDAQTLLEMRNLAAAAAGEPLVGESASAASHDGPPPFPDQPPAATPEDRLQAALAALRDQVLALQDQRIASLFLEGRRWIGWFVLAAGVATLIGGFASGFNVYGWLVGAAVGLALGAGLVAFFVPRGRKATLAAHQQIRGTIAAARRHEQDSLAEAKAASQRRAEEIVRTRDADVSAAQELQERTIGEANIRHAEELAAAEAAFAARIESLTAARDRALAEADAKYPPLLEQNDADRRRGDAENAARFDARRATANAEHETAWKTMADAWLAGFRAVADELDAMHARERELFQDFAAADWQSWRRPASPPEAIRFGQCPLPLQLVKNAIPDDKRLDPGVKRLVLPATLAFAEQPRLVLTAEGAGRRAAAETLGMVALRMLTSLPAGKVRFTIIDASGLGENFGAFMHLADHDEQLLAGGRIWTDSKHIDERLGLVAAHMEKVLQKYLRNEFATIHEYNLSAGEVAEPYHVVVAANFPTGFSEPAARKLVAISSSGPRCGVYTLISIDRTLRLPHEFKLGELLTDAVHLDWSEDAFHWRFPLFEKLPLELDKLPNDDRLSDVLRWAGRQSREASKVEVPFAMVAPAPDKLWAEDCGRELVVPIGRAGAKELQSLRLGIGTSQHVVTAGKTGSGKSTLLHALITNAALHYSPDQVEFYLVDFKKGVEFKAYATGKLPHARVIAIESEREFGVSVLERLDQELRRRGELYRQHGVQDVAGFRRARPDMPLPRTLLIIDEFQELFVADDKLAQDAALLLDRLVRQGRAFGIHVLLGSQTLSGAYSLARSTIGQMAVRIALECSEADAHLILSDENTAARLLTRPGEAIYNDQNGLLTGNHPFQVVWLPDAERVKYLAALNERAGAGLDGASSHVGAVGGRAPREPAIVFEGNVPADPRDNPDFVAALEHPERTTAQEPTIWLGAAVRIEPATHITLRRQGGHNLAIIGQHEEIGGGVLASAVLALAAQHGEAGAKFTVLDGTRPESHVPGLWGRVAATVGDAVEVVPPRSAAAAIHAIAEEVNRRTQSPEERYAAIYLVIYDLAQFRDLRQTEDDFSFSFGKGNGKPPAPDRQFRTILKEGPAVGVHIILWCESYNSLTRVIDRLTLREIEYRVATQMSAADSTSLIDSPAAALLGEHRAILYRDDLGTQTKFRPYGPPTPEWLAWCAEQLRREAEAKL